MRIGDGSLQPTSFLTKYLNLYFSPVVREPCKKEVSRLSLSKPTRGSQDTSCSPPEFHYSWYEISDRPPLWELDTYGISTATDDSVDPDESLTGLWAGAYGVVTIRAPLALSRDRSPKPLALAAATMATTSAPCWRLKVVTSVRELKSASQ